MQFLRWLLVIPVAILLAWLGWLSLYYPNLWMDKYVLGADFSSFLVQFHIETSGAFGFVAGFIWGGAYTAPKYKNITGFLLAVIMIILSLWSLYLGYGKQEWWSVYAAVVTIVGLGYVIFAIYSSPEESEELFSSAPWD